MTKIEKLEDIENPDEFLKSYNQANEDLKSIRAELKALEKERDELKTQVAEFDSSELDSLKDQLLKTKVRSALMDEGLPDVDGVVKYLNYEGVELDEDGKVAGLDERLEDLKNDLPTLFDAKKRAGRAGADIHEKPPAATAKSTTAAQVDALFDKRR
jgi:DNA repair ATPase RecN